MPEQTVRLGVCSGADARRDWRARAASECLRAVTVTVTVSESESESARRRAAAARPRTLSEAAVPFKFNGKLQISRAISPLAPARAPTGEAARLTVTHWAGVTVTVTVTHDPAPGPPSQPAAASAGVPPRA